MTKAIMVRPDGTLSPKALELLTQRAAEGKTQRSIAAELGLPLKKFELVLDRKKGDNPERLAWEAGHARIEQAVADSFLAAGMGQTIEAPQVDEQGNVMLNDDGSEKKVRVRGTNGGKNSVIALIYYSKAQLGWTEKAAGALVNDNRIQITLPGPMTQEAWFKGLGIDKPLDYRKDKTKPHPMLDVKAVPAALPAPAKEEKP